MAFGNIYDFDYKTFYRRILMAIPFENLYINVDFSHDPNHKGQFILLIIDEYIRMHATHWARIKTIEVHSKIIGNMSKKLRQNLGQ